MLRELCVEGRAEIQSWQIALERPVRVGLVGCGRVAEFGYLPAFRRAAGVKLVGVADVNLSRCREIAPQIPAHENVEALIEAGDVDALVISTPTRFHLAGARAAARAGLPVLLEKPPGLNLEEARALNTLSPSPWIGFNRRFDPNVRRLKNGFPQGGTIQLELCYRRASWKPLDMQDDALLDVGPHLIDLSRWLTGGEVEFARALSLGEHRAEFELMLERGRATVLCADDRYYRERIVIRDSRGHLKGSYQRGGLFWGLAARLRPKGEIPLVKLFVLQLEAFGLAVRGRLDGAPLATSRDGLAVMAVIDAVRRSASQETAPCAVRVPTD